MVKCESDSCIILIFVYFLYSNIYVKDLWHSEFNMLSLVILIAKLLKKKYRHDFILQVPWGTNTGKICNKIHYDNLTAVVVLLILVKSVKTMYKQLKYHVCWSRSVT